MSKTGKALETAPEIEEQTTYKFMGVYYTSREDAERAKAVFRVKDWFEQMMGNRAPADSQLNQIAETVVDGREELGEILFTLPKQPAPKTLTSEEQIREEVGTWKVLCVLADSHRESEGSSLGVRGAITIEAIARETRLDPREVAVCLKILVEHGYAQISGMNYYFITISGMNYYFTAAGRAYLKDQDEVR